MAHAAFVRSYRDDDTGPLDDAPEAASLPAGTVLASRYRLEELIAETR